MPDAFETAPPAATAVLASAGKIGPIAAIVWLALSVAGPTADRVLVIAALLSVASIVFGNLAALRQRSFSRMLAYSGVAQVGYALAGVALASGSQQVLIFAVLYGLTSVASFIFVVALREVEPSWDGSIPGLAGLSRRHPALAASLVVIMLSLTGIPLTAGFWGKFLIFGAASVGGYLWLAIVGMLGSVVSFGYYGGTLRAAFMDEERAAAPVEARARPRRPAAGSARADPRLRHGGDGGAGDLDRRCGRVAVRLGARNLRTAEVGRIRGGATRAAVATHAVADGRAHLVTRPRASRSARTRSGRRR